MASAFFRGELPVSLSAAESAELSARLAALAQSGLPLEGGLYALADEIGRPRLARALRNLAARLEAGERLEEAIAARGCRLPAYLRGLIAAGISSGRLPLVLDEFAAVTRRQQDLHRRIVLALIYPALLLGIMAALMLFFHLVINDGFKSIYRDFGTRLPDLTVLYLQCSGPIAWTAAGLTIAAVLLAPVGLFLPLGAWLGRAASWVPILGPVVRDDRLARFSQFLALLVEEKVPLPEALRLTAVAMQNTMLAGPCNLAAATVEQGSSLSAALALAKFPQSLTALVGWGQQQGGVAESLRAAADAFEARANSQGALLNIVVLPVMYLVTVTFIGITILALMMPLVSLISHLSG